MAEETPGAPAQRSLRAAPAPAETPAAASVAAPETPAAAPAETPVAQPETTTENPAEPAKPSAHDEPTLLEQAGEKPVETPAPQPESVPQAPHYEPFALPDGLTADAAQMDAYTALLGEHGVAQEAGQKLLDMHAGAMQRWADHLAEEQHRIWSETRAGWRNAVLSDEELGGSGHQTAMQAIARMRDLLVPEKHRQAFDDFLRVTGAGDHPAFLRLLHVAARHFDEPPPAPAGAMPTPDRGGAASGARRGVLYDHPRSPGTKP